MHRIFNTDQDGDGGAISLVAARSCGSGRWSRGTRLRVRSATSQGADERRSSTGAPRELPLTVPGVRSDRESTRSDQARAVVGPGFLLFTLSGLRFARRARRGARSPC